MSQVSATTAKVYELDRHRGQQKPIQSVADSPPVIFVTGASRSGTTMLARMLGTHSRIMAFQELHYFGSLWDPSGDPEQFSAQQLPDLAATLLARQQNGLWGGGPTSVERSWGRNLVRDLPPEQCNAHGLFGAVVNRLSRDAGKEIACEQTPRNIFYAEKLLELYPNARVVHIVRDPRAVLASQKNRWKVRKLGASHMPLSEAVRNWVNYHPVTMSQLWLKATQEAARMSKHPRFMTVRFEDLAADSEAGLRQICDFVDVPFEKEILDVPRWGSSNVEHSTESKGISSKVNDQWRKSLSKGEVYICEKLTRDMMLDFDYQPASTEAKLPFAMLRNAVSYPIHLAGVMAMNPGRALIQLKALARAKRKK